MTPAETILAALAQATSQRPVDEPALAKACALPRGEFQAAMQTLLADRRVCTCRLIKGGLDRHVYWPTGIVTPACSLRAQASAGRKPPTQPKTTPAPVTAPKPTRPKEAPMKPETNTAKLMVAVQKHGPLCAHDLAERTHVPIKNVDSSLAISIRNGAIVTRKGYAAERGKELKHYMTPGQAKAWDEKAADTAASANTADNSGGTAPAEPEIPVFLLKDQASDEVAVLKRRLHDQANDLAAVRMILSAIRERLGLPANEDGSTLETLDARLADHGQLGKPAIILVDDKDQHDLIIIQDDADPRERAAQIVQAGEIRTAIVARLLAKCTMPPSTPEWSKP